LVLLALVTGCTREQWHRFPSPDDLVAAIPWFSVMHTGIAIQPYKMPLQPVSGTVPVTGTEVVPPAIPQNRGGDATATRSTAACATESKVAVTGPSRRRWPMRCAI
jgi:hypothetical protein